VPSAIVIVGPEIKELKSSAPLGEVSPKLSLAAAQLQQGTSLACVEVLGRSVVGRLIEELRRAGVEKISLFADATVEPLNVAVVDPSGNTALCSTENPWSAAALKLIEYKETKETADNPTLVMRVGAYIEFELTELLQFHQEQNQVATRAFDDHKGPLDLWVVDTARLTRAEDLLNVLRATNPARYWVRGYVNRLEHAKDLRRLVVDGLSSRCRLRPQGSEARPGVWMDDGAQVHRDARVVAPAYIGRGTRIAAQCLVTRGSSVESNCQVDYGTVVEDSSILSNSYVGIGLDLSHSVVDGNNLLNLERNVTLEIADPCVIRQNRISRKEKNRQSPVVFGLPAVQFARAEEGSH
jgi:NDP-sugar pyrophosphorylase family protein